MKVETKMLMQLVVAECEGLDNTFKSKRYTNCIHQCIRHLRDSAGPLYLKEPLVFAGTAMPSPREQLCLLLRTILLSGWNSLTLSPTPQLAEAPPPAPVDMFRSVSAGTSSLPAPSSSAPHSMFSSDIANAFRAAVLPLFESSLRSLDENDILAACAALESLMCVQHCLREDVGIVDHPMFLAFIERVRMPLAF